MYENIEKYLIVIIADGIIFSCTACSGSDSFADDLRTSMISRRYNERQGITEELKARDQMEWVGAVNGIRNMAGEIVLKELVYI